MGCLLAALCLLGGGWYFAGQIRSDGLVRNQAATAYDLAVVSVSGGSSTVSVGLHEAPALPPNPSLRRTAVYGLAWPTGTGVLSATSTTGPAGAVVRTLTVTAGVAPVVGAPAALRRDVFDTPTGAYGAQLQDVTIPCAGGGCPAWYLPGTGRTWAILVHGKGASRTEPLRALGAAVKVGMPSLVISYRNDAGAPADPSGYYRYGSTEWPDLDNAVRYAQQRGARQVVLFGFSMGGAVVASFLQHSSRSTAVTGVVLDAPMLSFRRTVDFAAAQRTLPLLGTAIPPALTWTAQTIAGWRYGIGWDDIDYLDGHWLRVPALVFHGTDDLTVPIATSDELRQARPQLVELVRVDGAAHVESWNLDPTSYTATLVAFLQRVGAV